MSSNLEVETNAEEIEVKNLPFVMRELVGNLSLIHKTMPFLLFA